jgi:large subunit ribosomal protein L21
MYAIIETGGHQYKVRPGMQIDVERIDAVAGDLLDLDRVLLVADGGEPKVGQPTIAGARVRARVVGEVLGDKIVVFRYKPKSRYRRKTGHRQRYTRLAIEEIVVG